MKKITIQQFQILLITLLFSYTLNAQVGIGTNTPAYQFQMVNSGAVGAAPMADFRNSSASGVSLSAYNASATSGYNGLEAISNYNGTGFITAGVFGLSINTSGNGIGVHGFSNSNDGIGVEGGFVGGTTFVPGWAIYANGWAGGLTGWVNVSDKRLKSNIKTIDSALDNLMKLRGVEYNFDKSNYPDVNFDTTTKQLGFIAQEVEEIFPNLVRESYIYSSLEEGETHDQKERNQYLVKTLSYSTLIPVTVEAIKEQQKIIEFQNNRIKVLESRLDKLESKLNAVLNAND